VSRLDLSLEHRILKTLRSEPLPRRWLLAVSGGLDSMVMSEVVWKWRSLLKVDLAIGHVHHGTDGGPYRDSAQNFVRNWARERRVRFLSTAAKPRGLRSEADWRHFREATLERWRRQHGFDLIVLAHHRDDLLETRVLRLIRGTGAQGLRAMAFRSGVKLRPLLEVSRAELESYAKARQLQWTEDPSNREVCVLRNWLRHEWLPQLESQRPGSMRVLARSLETLSPTESVGQLNAFVGLRRKDLGRVSPVRQRELVAEYLRALGVKGYSRDHVLEILKRLASPRREFEFEMLGHCFRVTPDLLWASRV